MVAKLSEDNWYKIKESNYEKRADIYSYPSVTEVIFNNEWNKKSIIGMKCLECHRRPCICNKNYIKEEIKDNKIILVKTIKYNIDVSDLIEDEVRDMNLGNIELISFTNRESIDRGL